MSSPYSFRTAISCDDILLVPAYSSNRHSSDGNASFTYDKCPCPFTADIPIINSPMDLVCSKDLLILLMSKGIPTTIHRYFDSAKDQINCFGEIWEEAIRLHGEKVLKVNAANCFIGVGSIFKWKDWIDTLLNYRIVSGIKFGIHVDLANGATDACVETVKYLRKECPDLNIMAGNVATKGGFTVLEKAGANFIRCGIGGGCVIPDTRVTTNRGNIKIIDVKIGDKVLTHENNWKTVTGFNRTFVDDDLIVLNEKLTLTKQHEVFVIKNNEKDPKFIAAQDIKLGDSLCCCIDGKLSIEKLINLELNTYYRGSLYDIEVEDDHSFIANGIIAHNSICSTRIQTGFGVPTLTTVIDCESRKLNSYIVADGGFENDGDMIKAIRCGADMCMIGKILASTDLAPGEKRDSNFEVTTNPEEYAYCQYRGMSSKMARDASLCRKNASVEGVSGFVEYTDTTEIIVDRIKEHFETAISYYAGCKNWSEFRRYIKVIEITSAGQKESGTRIIKHGKQ